MDLKLPDEIEKVIENMKYKEISIGRSAASVYRFYDEEKTYYLKIEKENPEIIREVEAMKWLKGKVSVPDIVEYCKADSIVYLITSKIEGVMTCSDESLNNPEETVKLLAEGIKLLQQIDVSSCNFDASIEYKLKQAEDNIRLGKVDMDDFEEGNDFETPELLLKWLIENKPKEDLVFTHGDYCLPNIFIKDNKVSGFIDLGRSGVGDRWQDISLCVRSIKYNFKSDKYIDVFFNTLGLEADWERINYYILVDELF